MGRGFKDDDVERVELVEFKGTVLMNREQSWLFEDDRTGRRVWCPKSRCAWNADAGMMAMPEWLADKEKLR